MGKVIGATLAVLVGPQVVVGVFFYCLRAVLWGNIPLTDDWRMGLTFIHSIVFLISGIAAIAVGSELHREYSAEQQFLREKREKKLAALDAEIGIPNVGEDRV
jgi:hypothetical protein